MDKVISIDFKNRTKINPEDVIELSEIPEFNQNPTLELTERFKAGMDLRMLHKLINMYYEHPYLDPYRKTRKILAKLHKILICEGKEVVGVSQKLADKINADGELRKS